MDSFVDHQTNDEVLAVNQDPQGSPGQRIIKAKGVEIWVKKLKDGSKTIGFFNRTAMPANVTPDWTDANLDGKQALRDLWRHKNLGKFKANFSAEVPAHGVILLRAS